MWWNRPLTPSNLTVWVEPKKMRDTGLVFANGQKIYKVWEPEPIGFVHFPDPPEDD